MPPAPPSPRSASRRTSSQHGHGGRWPSSPPPLLPSSLTPERSHRAPFDHPSNVTAGDFSLHHGPASVVGAAASPRLRHFYSEHKPLALARVHLQARRARRTAEQASGTARAQRCSQRPRRLVPTQVAADASPALSLLFLSGGLVVPSLPGSRHPNYCPGWTVFHLPSTPRQPWAVRS